MSMKLRHVVLAASFVIGLAASLPAQAQDSAEFKAAYADFSKAMESKDFAAAGRALDRIVVINRATFGNDHPNTLNVIETRAAIAQGAGDNALSERLYKEALAGRAKIGAPEDEQIALDNNNLAQAVERQGRYAEAATYYRKALEIRQKTAKPDARELAISYNNLANALASAGKIDESEGLLRKALAINVAREGPEGELVASSISNLASALAAKGD
jgi:tetratricopeptide (TPR) repeat protein